MYFRRKRYLFQARGRSIVLGERTIIMGILNVTPDSFSDGGRFFSRDAALEHALSMVETGADIIDIGGESTRPGSDPVPAEEEISRVLPVIEAIRKNSDVMISVDTYKSKTAEAALLAGADIINDISGFRFDAEMVHVASRFGAGVVTMHIKGTPKDMQLNPSYDDLIGEIKEYLASSVRLLEEAGVGRSQIVIDPGIGFGKTAEDNLKIINRLGEFSSLDLPILVGPSRKSFIGKILDLPVDRRIFGTAGAVAAAIMKGAHIVRVHDIREMREVARVVDAIINEGATFSEGRR